MSDPRGQGAGRNDKDDERNCMRARSSVTRTWARSSRWGRPSTGSRSVTWSAARERRRHGSVRRLRTAHARRDPRFGAGHSRRRAARLQRQPRPRLQHRPDQLPRPLISPPAGRGPAVPKPSPATRDDQARKPVSSYTFLLRWPENDHGPKRRRKSAHAASSSSATEIEWLGSVSAGFASFH